MMAATKDVRLSLRLNAGAAELIRHAAEAIGQTVAEFMTASALDRAHEVLADQKNFVLDDETWNKFLAVLDRPVRPDPRLVELFSRPQRIQR